MSEIDLRNFDWVLVSSSAGKDSQAMLDLIAEQAREAGVLDRVVVVHADLGRVEWEGTRELAAEQAAHYGFRFEVVRRSQGDILDHVRSKHAANVAKVASGEKAKLHAPWSSHATRDCTKQHKIDQIKRLLTQLTRESRDAGVTRRVQILDCQGIRAEESSKRAERIAAWTIRNGGAWNVSTDAKSNGRRQVTEFYPIAHYTLDEVWARIAKAGTRSHDAYALGMPRLSCCFCFYAPRNALLIAATHNRELAEQYTELERETGFTFRSERSTDSQRHEYPASLQEILDAIDAGEGTAGAMTWSENA
jgi:3'-phosphoadenosine 5'-phosphosulfate sulfotransferase (PAPS reductase)/FAD synthetase